MRRVVCVLLALAAVGAETLGALAMPTPAEDPAIIKAGDWYYLFTTGPGITIQRSRDLLVWDVVDSVFRDLPAWMT